MRMFLETLDKVLCTNQVSCILSWTSPSSLSPSPTNARRRRKEVGRASLKDFLEQNFKDQNFAGTAQITSHKRTWHLLSAYVARFTLKLHLLMVPKCLLSVILTLPVIVQFHLSCRKQWDKCGRIQLANRAPPSRPLRLILQSPPQVHNRE